MGAQSIGGCKVTPTKERGWRKVKGAKAKRDYRDSYDYESQESFVIYIVFGERNDCGVGFARRFACAVNFAPPLLVCGGSFAPSSALRPHLCTPPLLCGISFAPPLCFAPSTLHPPSILRPLLCGDKRISKTKESKRIFTCKDRRRYSRKRAKFCRDFAKRHLKLKFLFKTRYLAIFLILQS